MEANCNKVVESADGIGPSRTSHEQSRPITPRQVEDTKRLTPDEELDAVRKSYAAAKAGHAVQIGDQTVAIMVHVELGVGWSIDPVYPVGKRVLVYCSLGRRWESCDVLQYDEETAVHEIQLLGQESALKLPLTSVKVRFPCFLGGVLPPRPDIRRMHELLQKLLAGYKNMTFEVHLYPGIRRGIRKLSEAVWQECTRLIKDAGKGDSDMETIKFAQDLMAAEDASRQEYQNDIFRAEKVSHLKLLTMPHWLQSKRFQPGDVVWAGWQKKYWPCLLVSTDQYIDLNDKDGTLVPTKTSITAEDEMAAVYYFGTHERQLISTRSLVDFAVGLDKGYLKRNKGRKDKRDAAVAELVDFLLTGDLSEEMVEVLQGVNALRLLPNSVNGRLLDPSAALEYFSDDGLVEDIPFHDQDERTMVAMSFKREWQPTPTILKGISTGDLTVERLGRVESRTPFYHSESHIFPVGYKIKRKMRSHLTKKDKSGHHMKMEHTIEIHDKDKDDRRSEEPVFRISVGNKVLMFEKGSSSKFDEFIRSTGCTKEKDGMLGKAGGTLLGLARPAIRDAIAMLPGIEMCGKIPLKRIEAWRLNFLRQTKFLLDEMKQCMLPDGIRAVPLLQRRPFECQVCCDVEEDEEDLILQCDGCKSCVHMSCYSVSEAPHGNLWLCDVCQARPLEHHRPACVLCPVTEGAMKRTTEGKWCHPACAIWIPETHLMADETYMNLRGLIAGVKKINRSRLESRCMFCKQVYGAVIQCCEEGSGKECYKTFHYMCARNNQCELRLDTHDPDWVGPASPPGRIPVAPQPESNSEDNAETERRDMLELLEEARGDPGNATFIKKDLAGNLGVSSSKVICQNCAARSSPTWRLGGADDSQILCDDCGLWWIVNKSHRPATVCGQKRKPGSDLGKRKRKKPESAKGTPIGNTRLLAFCPKHSRGHEHGGQGEIQQTNVSNPSSVVNFEERSFPGLDIAAWKERHGDVFNKSSYVQANSLAPIGPIPDPLEAAGTSIHATGKLIMCDEGLGCKSVEGDPSQFPRACLSFLDDKKTAVTDIMSMAAQYDKLTRNWRKDIHPGKSAIHGWGAFPHRNVKKGEMVIEYVGELVRPTFAEIRESKMYDDLVGAGTYVFRLNAEHCVDATRTGNLAHLLNHSCDPNCASRTITVKGRDGKPVDYVVIFALKDIEVGVELTYDYRFSGEEILQCSCGSQFCRGKVNAPLPAAMESCYASGRHLRRSIIRTDTL